jgi:PAS domain S-box-containing protein
MKSSGPSKTNVSDALAKISRIAELGAGVTVALMVALGIASYQQLDTQLGSRRWVLHTYAVLHDIEQIRGDTLMAELSTRKYFDTKSQQYVNIFRTARRNIMLGAQHLQGLVNDNAEQSGPARTLVQQEDRFLSQLEQTITANDEQRLVPIEHDGMGEQIAQHLKNMRDRENQLLGERTERMNEISQSTFWLIAVVSAFAVAMQAVFAAVTRYWARSQRQTETRLKATLGSMAEGLTQIDLAGRIIYMNPAAEGLLGYQLKNVLGKNFHDLVHYLDIDGEPRKRECGIRNVIESGITFNDKNDVFVHKDGYLIPVQYSSAPLVEDGATISGAVVCFSDISERLAVDKRLREFYSIVSHELRTPLTSIRAAFGLLEGAVGGDLSVKGKHLVQIGRQESDRLVRLINNILDMKKIESGKLDLHLVQLDCAELVRDTINSMNSFAEAAGVSLMASVPEDLAILADSDRATQVLTNLISNAIKFSREGTTVAIRVQQPAKDAQLVRFEVQDHGPGIPDDKLPVLFGMFQQVDSTDSRSKGGTGLGLAISKAIVESHGGKIGVESALEQGSTFWFTLPLAFVDSGVIKNTLPIRNPDKQLVLVVDDDEATCQLVKQRMEALSLDCEIAVNGRDAVRMAKHLHPDLIVLDVLMEDGNGFDVVNALCRDEMMSGTSLVVYTAKDLTDDDKKALKLGNTEWLIKSRTSDEDLERAIKALLASKPQR